MRENNLELSRGKFAYEQVKGWSDECKTRVLSLPIELRRHGLLVVCSHLIAKNKHIEIVRSLAAWLEKSGAGGRWHEGSRFLGRLAAMDKARYFGVQNEIAALLEHLKRFAVAELELKKKEQNDHD